MGQLWLNHGELWGFMGIYVKVVANASVFLIPFVFIPADMSDSDFHAFNNNLYVPLHRMWYRTSQITASSGCN